MREEHAAGVDLMQDIKAAIDPDGILNPEKVLPE
jgi:FAD/FMN-containing dehydrogenase